MWRTESGQDWANLMKGGKKARAAPVYVVACAHPTSKGKTNSRIQTKRTM